MHLAIIPSMRDESASRARRSGESDAGEYATFQDALKVLSVPHSAIKAKLKANKGKRPKRAASRVSHATD